MFRRTLSIVSITVLATAILLPQFTTAQTSGPRAPVAAAPEKTQARLADLEWLAGTWRAEMKEGHVEQVIWPVKGGEMAGMFRLWNGEQTLALELFTIRQAGDGVEMRIRHFTSELKPWEKQPIVLTLTERAGKRTVFTNFVNNDPKRSIVTHNDDGSFTSRVEIVGEDGKDQSFELTLQRVQPGL
jgi:hypothetical protein